MDVIVEDPEDVPVLLEDPPALALVNWPLWKRDVILVILSAISVIASTLSSLLAANTVTLSLYFGRDFTQMALLTGYHLCGVGVAGFIFVASARIWGKRHLYLLGTVLIIISSAWGGAVGTNYASLLWARVIQGVGLAPFEALVNASVGDLYYVHERGTRMALSNLALFGGAFFAPVLVGKITQTIGWQWSFNLIAIFTGALLPLIFFFVPETGYNRQSSGCAKAMNNGNPRHTNEEYELPETSNPTSFDKHDYKPPNGNTPPKTTFAQSLLPFNGRKSNANFIKLVLRPFPLFLHPAVLWACLIQGTLIGWTVMIGVVLAAIFLGPPLWFNEVETGYMYTGPFVGAIIGFLVSGLLADWSTRFMIKRNKGVYEPEFRIVLVVVQLVFGCVGLYGFGITAEDVERYGWFLPDMFFAFEVAGMVLGAVASALYIVDAHREIAVEAFTCLLVFKNMFSFGLTWGAYNWVVEAGKTSLMDDIGENMEKRNLQISQPIKLTNHTPTSCLFYRRAQKQGPKSGG
ncbi:MAG: hypothetical protein LQ343_007070 [Gyalolechia ehrenbergii]|nr:MAG: hypothetical protein LQ343_007070 [Gyalolechia ehrenbergii]